jgi:hypothetical protein
LLDGGANDRGGNPWYVLGAVVFMFAMMLVAGWLGL